MPPHIMFRVFFGLPSQPANDDHPGAVPPAFLGSRLTPAHAPAGAGQPASRPALSIPVPISAAARRRAHLTMIDGSRG
ncbi:MAG TPA: hypothetical protein VND94_08560 [Terriglobia bacterium]|nr:hypothetical protein [Terriglobia bacterium]